MITERIIEDILTTDKSIFSEILNIHQSDLSLIARQKVLESGKLDMLFLHKDEILLIELKVEEFKNGIIDQINKYFNSLLKLQEERKLIKSKIRRIILVTNANKADIDLCHQSGIELIIYNPEYVLNQFYENFREVSQFMKIQSGDYGVYRIGLIISTLNYLNQGLNLKEISHIENKSIKTITNRLAVASLLNLVNNFKSRYYLTDLGYKLINNESNSDDRLSEKQIEILTAFIIENPYYSQITYTILSVVESVFILTKNAYPVPYEMFKEYFVKLVGKTNSWKSDKSKITASNIFSNYCCELNLVVKINNSFYLTPDGIKAILLLQLNRSIKLIESKR